MGIVIESEVWEPNPYLYIFLLFSSLFSLTLLPHFTKNSNRTIGVFDLSSVPASFRRFQGSLLLIYSLASVMEGLGSVFGEFEYASYGISREQIVLSLCVGSAASLLVGSLLGIIGDLIGQKKVCLLFCVLHLLVGIWKRLTMNPCVWVASICLAVASSIFSFGFEMWVVAEHEKLGHRQALSDTFWLMAFSESASHIGSQILANSLASSSGEQRFDFLYTAAIFLATICLIYVTREWKESPNVASIGSYRMSFSGNIIGDKRIWLLAWAQACLQFSIMVVWILWAPTVVADGREVRLGMIYPCFMGARMLGSTAVSWFTGGPSPVRSEDYLLYAFIVNAIVLSIAAYDYQEIGVLVTLFCIFHACVGLILPSLAQLRTMYVPNELRGGMISLSTAPANAAMLIVLIQGGYHRNVGNATIMAFAAFGLFSAAGCMHQLKKWGKHPHQNWHKL
ncbi:molybdate-anion transporter [Macadamia integrifolia]|uniref:molybdate-anion transporter n=1 Tax=Macadamia integrifolia TaxID=60698 RepID=UPI001C4F272B|nr:molybdate-anion transporter [Macadamia integrifolia]